MDEKIMPAPDPDENKTLTPLPDAPDAPPEDLAGNLTLENIIDLTGELEHLNELVMLTLEKDGGFTCTDAYFTKVQPVLDLLEVEIRVRYRPGMSRNQMKLIIQDWIDGEIRELQ